jgi:hypothetical protein
MNKATEFQIIKMLREAARRRYGAAGARRLLPALRETARAIQATKSRPPAIDDQPAFFIPSTRIR